MTPGATAGKGPSGGYRLDLRDRLPLPLALLYRRTFNAKSKIERHHGAYFLLEAIVKTAAAAQAAAWLVSGAKDAAVEKHLTRLARPAFGDWVAILRDVSAKAAALDPHPFPEVAPVAALLREKRADLVAVKAAVVEMGKRVDGVASFGGDRASAFDLFERLVAYRNQAIAHAALRKDEGFYFDMGRLLLDAALEVVERVPLFGNSVLAFVSEVRETNDGKRFADAWDLTGPECLLSTPPGGEEEPAGVVLRSGRLYLKKGAQWLDLHPLLVCEPVPPDASVAYLNRSQEGRIEYLDYVSGETSAAPSLLEDHRRILGRILGREVSKEGLESLVPAGAPPAEPAAPAGAAQVRRFGDFDIHSVLGEGGMGTVYLAVQRSLARPVALKVLPPALSSNEVAAARFLREVKALARADHPNVVRILASGRTEGTHWYAMEYVEGSDLSEVAKSISSSGSNRDTMTEADLARAVSTASERRRGDAASAFPGTPAAERPPAPDLGKGRSFHARLAEVFRDAASGLQHLHERGILHRDVKPGNLMLTRGEGRVVVMDLGLARLAGDASMTAASSVLGTIAYAAPEQIQESLVGRRVDARADVYGLGATLYEMATGKPPYQGASPTELTAQVLRGALVPPHRVDRSVPRDLDAVIRKAMEHDVERRYVSAAAFADDLDRFARGDPVTASPPGIGHLIRLWVRKNRAVATVAVAAVVLLVVGVALFLRSLAVERDRALSAESAANAERKRAQGLADYMLFNLQQRLRPLGRLDLLDDVVRKTREYFESLPAGQVSSEALRTYAASFTSSAEVLKSQGKLAQASEVVAAALSLQRRLVSEGASDPVRRADLARTLLVVGDVRREQGDLVEAEKAYREAFDLLTRLTAETPADVDRQRDLAATHERFATMKILLGDLKAALSEVEKAHAIRRRLSEGHPDDAALATELAMSHLDLGEAIAGDLNASLDEFKKGRAILQGLADKDPSNALVAETLANGLTRTGVALKEQGDVARALESYEAAAAVLARLAEKDPTNAARGVGMARGRFELAEVWLAMGDLSGAQADYTAAQDGLRRASQTDPANRDWERDYGRSFTGIGNVLFARGDVQGALKAYESGHAIRSRLAASDPRSARGQRDTAFGLQQIGDCLAALGDLDGAWAKHQEALAIRRRLVAEDPHSTRVPRDLWLSLVAVGDLRSARGEGAEALAAFREASDVAARLLQRDARNTKFRRDVAVSHAHVATALLATKDATAAEAEVAQALPDLTALCESDPKNADWQADLADALLRASDVRRALSRTPDALADARKAKDVALAFVAASRSNPPFRHLLASALSREADLLLEGPDPAEGRKALEAAERLLRGLVEEQPSQSAWRREAQSLRARVDALAKPPSPGR